MTPLQRVAMGIVIVVLDTLGGYDLLPDWAGWSLVLWGVAALDLPDRGALVGSAALAAAVALAVWFPAVHEPLSEAELSLRWAASLPDLLLVFLLGRALAGAAGRAAPPDRRFRSRFGVISWVAVGVALLPPVAEAAGSPDALAAGEVAVVLMWLWLVWNLFAAHARPWVPRRPVAA